MEFVTGKCPECEGELQIPPNREKIICMYCGSEIETSQAMCHTEKAVELTEEDKLKYETYVMTAMEKFPDMLFAMEDPLKNFKKNIYEENFKEYVIKHQTAMDAMEDAYMISEEPALFLKELADELIRQVKQKLEAAKNKRYRENALTNYNMSLVIYVNPALIDYNIKSGMPFAEELIIQWKEEFPQTNLKISSFEKINAGFKKRFCYITTAVCNSLGKPDNCYELKLLRDYRDGYLKRQENGEELIKRYYDIAPTVVKRINKNPKREKIYKNIWNAYLSPCIQMIEDDEKELCMVVYTDMVEDLAHKYFN